MLIENMTFIIVVLLGVALLYDGFIKQKLLKQTIHQNKDLIHKSQSGTDTLRDRIYDPLTSPETTYIPTSLNRQSVPYQYQMMGILYLPDTDENYNPDKQNRYVLYGRPNYQNTNKYDYYVIEEGGTLKIPLDQTTELYSGDTSSITGLTGSYIATIYETEQVYYSPF